MCLEAWNDRGKACRVKQIGFSRCSIYVGINAIGRVISWHRNRVCPAPMVRASFPTFSAFTLHSTLNINLFPFHHSSFKLITPNTNPRTTQQMTVTPVSVSTGAPIPATTSDGTGAAPVTAGAVSNPVEAVPASGAQGQGQEAQLTDEQILTQMQAIKDEEANAHPLVDHSVDLLELAQEYENGSEAFKTKIQVCCGYS